MAAAYADHVPHQGSPADPAVEAGAVSDLNVFPGSPAEEAQPGAGTPEHKAAEALPDVSLHAAGSEAAPSIFARQLVEEPDSAWRRGRERIAKAAGFLGAAALWLIPVAHFAFEDSAFADAQQKLMPQGFTDMRGVLIGTGLTALMGASGFGLSWLTNKMPSVTERVNKLGERPRNIVLRIGKTALDWVKKPLEWTGSVIEWTGSKVEQLGGKLEQSSKSKIKTAGRCVKAMAGPIMDTGEVVAMGTPGAVAYEVTHKTDKGPTKELTNKRIARLEALFLATWYPTFWAVKELVHRVVYDGLGSLAAHGIPLAEGADTGAHDLFKGIGYSVDPTKLPGQLFLSAAALLMLGSGLWAEHERRRNDEGSDDTPDEGIAFGTDGAAAPAPL
jgi:hypothetical protein